MVASNFFEKEVVLKYIGRYFQKIMNCSQDELGKKIGKNQSYVNRVLNGKAPGTKSQLGEFAKALGMSETEYEDIVRAAKKYEYKLQFGEEIEKKISEKELTAEEIDEIIMTAFDLSPEEFKRLVRAIKS